MKTTQEKIAVMQAHSNGKEIEVFINGKWTICDPYWNWELCDYRIKPEPQEPKYRPYKSAEEVLEDMAVHGPMVKTCGRYFAITEMDCERIWLNVSIGVEYAKMFNRYEWQDGTPFGRKEDEV